MDPKSIATSKTVIFNVLMVAMSLGGLKYFTFTQEELQMIAGAIAVLWGTGAIVLRKFTNRPVTVGPLTKAGGVGAVVAAGILLGGCLPKEGIGSLATDKRFAQAEAVLAAGNAIAQVLIADGTIPEKAVPKVQASIRAAELALAQAKAAAADGKLDVNDAIAAAMTAAVRIPAIVAEFQR